MMTRKWQVKIPSGAWMAGTHSFRLKREAEAFAEEWRRANASSVTYGDLPIVEGTQITGFLVKITRSESCE